MKGYSENGIRPSVKLDVLSATTGISISVLRGLLQSGKLEGFYAGRSIYVFLDSVISHQEGARVQVKAKSAPSSSPRSRRYDPAQEAAVKYLRENGVMMPKLPTKEET